MDSDCWRTRAPADCDVVKVDVAAEVDHSLLDWFRSLSITERARDALVVPLLLAIRERGDADR